MEEIYPPKKPKYSKMFSHELLQRYEPVLKALQGKTYKQDVFTASANEIDPTLLADISREIKRYQKEK